MPEFVKGEKVEIYGNDGVWHKAIIKNQSYYREPNMEYAVELTDIVLDDFVFCPVQVLRKYKEVE